MTVRNAKPLLAVPGYFALSFCGFSLLYRWGCPITAARSTSMPSP